MNTKQKNDQQFYHRSAYAGNENLHILAEAGWNYAWVVLFSTHRYCKAQQEKIINHIFNFLAGNSQAFEGYIEFCKRISLAADHTGKHNNGRMPIPALVWFDPSYTEGFQRTGLLYKQFLEKPFFQKGQARHWKALAEAILDNIEENSKTSFDYWANWFRQRRAWEFLYFFIQAHTYNNLKDLFYE